MNGSLQCYSFLKGKRKGCRSSVETKRDLSLKVRRGDGMSEKRVNSKPEWLMFVVWKGKVKLSLLTQPLPIDCKFHTLYSSLRLH